jgi:hypothetical protein
LPFTGSRSASGIAATLPLAQAGRDEAARAGDDAAGVREALWSTGSHSASEFPATPPRAQAAHCVRRSRSASGITVTLPFAQADRDEAGRAGVDAAGIRGAQWSAAATTLQGSPRRCHVLRPRIAVRRSRSASGITVTLPFAQADRDEAARAGVDAAGIRGAQWSAAATTLQGSPRRRHVLRPTATRPPGRVLTRPGS